MRAAALALAAALAGCAGGARRGRRPEPPPSALAKAVVRTARSYLPEEEMGRPAPRDCSDFVGRVFAEHGIRLPRTAGAMARLGEPVAASSDLRMADLLFFAGRRGGRRVGHVGLYIHNGIFIHQSDAGEGVRLESLYSDYYRRRYLAARRVIPSY